MTKRVLLFLMVMAIPATTFAQAGSWGGGGGASSGSAVSGCTAYSLVYIDSAGNLACAQAAQNSNVSTAGNAITKINATISGSSATSNFLNITGTFPATLSADTSAIYASVAFDNDSQQQAVIRSVSTGTGAAANYTASLWGDSQNTGQVAMGGYFTASGAATTTYGVRSHVTAGGVRVGGEFALGITSSSGTSAGLIADNSGVAANIFEARDNGTAVFTIADGGAVTATQNIAISSGVSFVPGNNVNSLGGWQSNTTLTPDAQVLFLGSLSTSLHLMETGDVGAFDYQNPCTTGLGTVACTDPTLIIHSHNQDTGEFLSMAHDGKSGVIVGGNSTVLDGTIRLGGTVTLTESSATSVLTVPVAVSTGTGGEIMYTVEAKDATNTQVRRGSVRYAVANNSSGTETCGVYGVDNAATVNPAQTNDGSGAGAITSGTLTYAWSSDTSGTNNCVLKLNGVSSLTQTTFQIHYTVIQSGPGVPTGGD